MSGPKTLAPVRRLPEPAGEDLKPQRTQSGGPVRVLIFCSISIFLLASLEAGRRSQLVQISREFTAPYLSTGISNLLQPDQAEVMLGQLSTYLASWFET
jgi:hypothetical protein